MAEIKRLSRADIAAAADVKSRDIEVPEWGGTVTVRGLRAGDLLELQAAQEAKQLNGKEALLWIAAHTIVDEKGERIFGDSEEDRKALAAKNINVLVRLTDAAAELSGMSDAVRKATAENLPEAQTSGSPAN